MEFDVGLLDGIVRTCYLGQTGTLPINHHILPVTFLRFPVFEVV